MDKLLERIKKEPVLESFLRAYKDGMSALISGVGDEFLDYLITLVAGEDRPFFAVFPTEAEAKQFVDRINEEEIVCEYMPPREKIYYEIKVIDDKVQKDRLSVFQRMINGEVKLIALSLFTLYDFNLNLDFYRDKIIKIKKGDRFNFEELVSMLISSGFKREPEVSSRGEFSLRGDIVDIFPICGDGLVRIEFFDDEVDTIRLVDSDSRLSTEYIDEVEIFPSEELIIDDYTKKSLIDGILQDLEKKENREDYKKFDIILEKLRDDSYSSEREILFSYFPEELKVRTFDLVKDYNILFIYPDLAKKEILSYYEYLDMELSHLYLSHEIMDEDIYGDRLFEPDAIKEIKNRSFYVSGLPYNINDVLNFELKIKSVPKYGRDFNEIFKDISKYENEKYRIYLSASDDVKIKAVEESFLEHGFPYTYEDSDENNIVITKKSISNGFVLPSINLVVFGDLNIFGFGEKRGKRKKSKSSSNLRIQDINVGDYVIHEDHGVGEYNGVKTLDIKGVRKDYLEILYKDKDKLYLPVENINQIDKYTSKEGAKPRIYGLDSIQWKKTKEKTRKAINEMAKELIELYAVRSKKEGFQFSKDTEWQHEFEDSFKYVETEGQLMAIDEIKADMESKKPMDRLLLGDVGYGKTEVALRAAFKAIMDGKQVAMLTPTTLLAEQHTKTAEERFKNFPVKIRNLSRFRTKKEIDKTVKDLAMGQVDMVIGTHRLLSKDVKFKDLGLLIIDEEQRFGVKHKERIKSLADDVDVLTLSATPIPRTLSMSLSGIRSMSVIEEPPHNRIPVQTYVLEYNENIIRSAVLKEINRGGQIFFLYNDVKSMEVIKGKLEELIPEARFFIANGQMSERELEDVFYRFENKESDVLITSTIIETGMDLPNVNTLIVYNSDRFGLSTLYQLRGRVGRSNRLAYAYFTYDKSRSISEKAIKRLMAMKEFTDFGSGYKIAMRDLELRGAGNVLGLSQSGHMAEVGYELYMKYLNYAIGELQGKPVRETLNTKIDFMVESAVPEGFIEDTYIRMELYRRISNIQTFKEKDDLTDEIIDRFGDIPEALINLLNIGLIKNIASKHFVKSIIENNNIIKIDYAPEMLDDVDMAKLLKDFPDGLRFDSKLPIIRISIKVNAIETVYKFFNSAFGV